MTNKIIGFIHEMLHARKERKYNALCPCYTLYDDDYFEEQFKHFVKMLPTFKDKKIKVVYIPNSERLEESLDKIYRIKACDKKRIILDVPKQPIKFP